MAANISPDDAQAPPAALALAALPLPVLVIDRRGQLLAWSAGAAEWFDRAEIALPVPLASLPVVDPDVLLQDICAAARGGQVTLVKADRSLSQRMHCLVQPLFEHRASPSHFVLLKDYGSRLDDGFAALNAKLETANRAAAEARATHRQLEQDYAAMEQFSSVAAHDLRSPLRGVSSLLDFLIEDYGSELPDGALSLVERTRMTANRLYLLIDELLDHARSGTDAIRVATIDFNGLVPEVLDAFGGLLQAQMAEVIVDPDLPVVTGDTQLADQLLRNLIDNALKYRSGDRAPRIHLRRNADGDLIVADNGIGFDPTLAERLFEPFFREGANPTTEGTGLGLATCRNICRRLGWHIDADGTPGHGAEFRIRFSAH